MDLFLEDKASKLQIMELETLLLKEAELAFKVRLARKILRGAKPREYFYFNPIKIFKKIKNNN